MFTSATAIEILTRIAGKVAQTLHLVLYGMGVDDVHDDGNTHLVGRINQLLQLFRCSEAR